MIKVYNPVFGVPITFLNYHNPEQFDIISFRKGDDGKDLIFTGGGEIQFNHTFVSLYDGDSWYDKKCRREVEWESYLRSNNNKKEMSPIDYFFPNSIDVGGLMQNPKDTEISGKSTYARILIRRK